MRSGLLFNVTQHPHVPYREDVEPPALHHGRELVRAGPDPAAQRQRRVQIVEADEHVEGAHLARAARHGLAAHVQAQLGIQTGMEGGCKKGKQQRNRVQYSSLGKCSENVVLT